MYYTIERRWEYPGKPVLGDANGKLVPNGKAYFERIGKGEVIYDAPVFDYFFLESYGDPKDWEWKLQDVHRFIGEYPVGGYLFISDYFKQLLEQFKIAEPYHFYPSKLKYKSQKLDYYIFRLNSDLEKNVNFQQSSFILQRGLLRPIIVKKIDFVLNNLEHFNAVEKEYREKQDLGIAPEKVTIKYNYDLIALFGINADVIISERLKQAIEKAKIEGLEIKPTSYEVIMPEE